MKYKIKNNLTGVITAHSSHSAQKSLKQAREYINNKWSKVYTITEITFE